MNKKETLGLERIYWDYERNCRAKTKEEIKIVKRREARQEAIWKKEENPEMEKLIKYILNR